MTSKLYPKIPYAVKISSMVREQVQQYCATHGLKQGYFVEKALQEQLAREELLEDLRDFKSLKSQEPLAADLSDYLKRRRKA